MSRLDEFKEWVESRKVSTDSVDKTRSLDPLREDAARVAHFASMYWSAEQGTPGLEDAGFGLSKDVLADIDYAVNACGWVHEHYISQLQLDADTRAQLDRGQHLLFDFETFLNWYLASSDNDEWDDRIETMEAEHPDTDMNSLDDVAHALYDYAALSNEILEHENEVAGLSSKTVEEAMRVVSKLVDLSSNPIPISDELKALLKLKFQLVAILRKDVEKIQKAAHFVFRHHPKILEKVLSTHLSTNKVAAYRAKKINSSFYRERKEVMPLRFLPRGLDATDR